MLGVLSLVRLRRHQVHVVLQRQINLLTEPHLLDQVRTRRVLESNAPVVQEPLKRPAKPVFDISSSDVDTRLFMRCAPIRTAPRGTRVATWG